MKLHLWKGISAKSLIRAEKNNRILKIQKSILFSHQEEQNFKLKPESN